MFLVTRRSGVFETNSSSTHSISVSTKELNLDKLIPPKGHKKIFSSGGEYGWEFKKYFNPKDKLDYLVTFLFQNCRSYKDFLKVKQTDKKYQMLKDVIYEHCGFPLSIKLPKREKKWDYYMFGYIDHQSAGVSEKSGIFSSKTLLAAFLFNPNSFLETGNDNT